MTNDAARDRLRQQIIAAAAVDPRVIGVVDYGSTSEGRGDEWSDIDLALMRLEAGATARFRSTSAAVEIEHAISPARLTQLNVLIPAAVDESLRRSLHKLARTR